jgi:hypothetical protein
MSDTVSTNSIKAQMPHPILTRVQGEPMHKQLKLILRELTANHMAVSCPWDTTKATWDSSKTHPSTLHNMEHHSTYQLPNHLCIPLYLPAPPPISVRSSRHKAPPHAKRGLPTASSAQSLATNLLPPSTTYSMPSSMIQSRA